MQYGSFTKAAEKLFITQAGLSAMISEIERQIGQRLFERTTRTVRLTEAGTLLVPTAIKVVEEIEYAVLALAPRRKGQAQRLRIGVTPLVADTLLPTAMATFEAAHPEVSIEVIDADRQRVQELVEKGSLDAGFGLFATKVSGVQRSRLFQTELVYVVPKQSGADNGPKQKRMKWRDLRDCTLISLPDDNSIQRLIESHLKAAGIFPVRRRTVSHISTVLALIEKGLGTAILPAYSGAAFQRYEVSWSPLTLPKVTLDFYCITRSGSQLPPLLSEFSNRLVPDRD